MNDYCHNETKDIHNLSLTDNLLKEKGRILDLTKNSSVDLKLMWRHTYW